MHAELLVVAAGGARGFLISLPDVGRRGEGAGGCGFKVISNQTSRMESDASLQRVPPRLLSPLYFSSYKLLAHDTLPLHHPHTRHVSGKQRVHVFSLYNCVLSTDSGVWHRVGAQ